MRNTFILMLILFCVNYAQDSLVVNPDMDTYLAGNDIGLVSNTSTLLNIGKSGTHLNFGVFWFDLSSLSGETIDSAQLSVFEIFTTANSGWIYAYRITNSDIDTAGMCYQYADTTSPGTSWTSGNFSSDDVTIIKYDSTWFHADSVTGTEHTFDIGQLIQDIIDNINYGIVIGNFDIGDNCKLAIDAIEGSNSDEWPELRVYYNTAAACDTPIIVDTSYSDTLDGDTLIITHTATLGDLDSIKIDSIVADTAWTAGYTVSDSVIYVSRHTGTRVYKLKWWACMDGTSDSGYVWDTVTIYYKQSYTDSIVNSADVKIDTTWWDTSNYLKGFYHDTTVGYIVFTNSDTAGIDSLSENTLGFSFPDTVDTGWYRIVVMDTNNVADTTDFIYLAGSKQYSTPVIDSIRYKTTLRDSTYLYAVRNGDTCVIYGSGLYTEGDSSQVWQNSTGSARMTVITWWVDSIYAVPEAGSPKGYYYTRVKNQYEILSAITENPNFRVKVPSIGE